MADVNVCLKCERQIWLRKVGTNAATGVDKRVWCHDRGKGAPTMECPEGGYHRPV